MFFYGTICPPNLTQFQFFSSRDQTPSHDFPFPFEQKKRNSESYIDWIFQWLSNFRETFTAPAVAASNSVDEGSSSILYIAILADLKAVLQLILDNVVIKLIQGKM